MPSRFPRQTGIPEKSGLYRALTLIPAMNCERLGDCIRSVVLQGEIHDAEDQTGR
jgi:hypothetical protein